jgi:large-conductance mechanosensitive channel
MAKEKEPTKAEILKIVEDAKEDLEKVPSPKLKKPFVGFVAFIREQGIVGLAIGFVMGVQVKALVDQFVFSFVNPILGLAIPGGGSLLEKNFTITFNGNTQKFTWGLFVYQLITFVAVAAIIYFTFKFLKLDKLDKKKDK